jgi:hypothetical protein
MSGVPADLEFQWREPPLDLLGAVLPRRAASATRLSTNGLGDRGSALDS